MIETTHGNATYSIARELADFDGCLGVARDQQLVFALGGFLANPFDFFEDGIRFGDLFLT
jgi:hypothetical protein